MKTKTSKSTVLITLIVALIIVVVAIILNAYKSPFNQKTTTKATAMPTEEVINSEFSNIAGNLYLTETRKNADGYFHTAMKHKNYKNRMIDALDAVYSILALEDGEVIYKRLHGTCWNNQRYGDEIFYFEGDRDGEWFKAINVETKETRVIFDKDFAYFNGPMIYKDKLYYSYYNWWYTSDFDTPKGYISVANLNGERIEDIKLKNFDNENDIFLGIAYDRIYYTSGSKTCAVIKSCKIDGSDYKVVAEGFKMRYNRHWKSHKNYSEGITFDETGWYFLGGNKPPYKDLCKVNFDTGKAEVIKKNMYTRIRNENKCVFDVYDEYAYYRNNKNKYIYRINMVTGKEEIFLKKKIKLNLFVKGKYLYFKLKNDFYRINIEDENTSRQYEKVVINFKNGN